jgi:hypothetical protein
MVNEMSHHKLQRRFFRRSLGTGLEACAYDQGHRIALRLLHIARTYQGHWPGSHKSHWELSFHHQVHHTAGTELVHVQNSPNYPGGLGYRIVPMRVQPRSLLQRDQHEEFPHLLPVWSENVSFGG